jgi:hypothetical protein
MASSRSGSSATRLRIALIMGIIAIICAVAFACYDAEPDAPAGRRPGRMHGPSAMAAGDFSAQSARAADGSLLANAQYK